MPQYCKKHPGVQLVPRRGRLVCPRCEDEEYEKKKRDEIIRKQEKLLYQQHKALIEAREREANQERRQQEERDKQLIRLGIVEFDQDFQNQWLAISREYKKLIGTSERVERLYESIREEFDNHVRSGTMPDVVEKCAEKKVKFRKYSDDLNNVYERISDDAEVELLDIEPGKSITNLYRTIRDIYSKKAYIKTHDSKLRVGLWIYAVISLILGLSCSSVCESGSNVDLAKPTLWAILFIWPAMGIIAYQIINTIRVVRLDLQISTYKERIHRYLDMILNNMLDRESKDGDIASRLDEADQSLFSILANCYDKISDRERGVSAAKDEISAALRETGEYDSIERLRDDLEQVEEYYQHMRNDILQVGEEIEEGIRVPARMKKERIKLRKCPSCGGPLSVQNEGCCPYCGMPFSRI